MNTQDRDIIAELNAYIAENCSPVDVESIFNDMLDEEYSDCLKGPFESMQPSRVLKEMDETAYNTMRNDWSDGKFAEVEGSDYYFREVDNARDSFVSELQDKLSELEEDEEENADAIQELETLISKVERHSF